MESQIILCTLMAFSANDELSSCKNKCSINILSPEININLGKGVLRAFNRAILPALEISNLLRGGYPFGAKARLRLLYELEIITAFMVIISKTQEGRDIGQAYIDYEEVEEKNKFDTMVKSFKKHIKHREGKLSELAIGEERSAALEDADKFKKALAEAVKESNLAKAKVDTLKDKYNCKNFEKPYGWAKPFANVNTFKDIQDSVDRAWGILWKEGSVEVHGNASGASFPKNSQQKDCMCLGPTDLGFAEIISDTSIALETLAYALAEAMQSKELLLSAHIVYGLTSLSLDSLPQVLARHPMAKLNHQ